MYLLDFDSHFPPCFIEQEEVADWIEQMHTRCDPSEAFRAELRMKMEKVFCKKEKIARRYFSVPHTMRENWESMGGIGERGRYFQTYVEEVFEHFYPEDARSPSDLIHVTCTGYNSPSAAQKIVAKRGWSTETTVTHAYHMGCMGAVPAIRMAAGFASYKQAEVDIVHTELCSLHFTHRIHTYEQLLAQSLFADGLIKYTLQSTQPSTPAFKVLAIQEHLIPNTANKMTWVCEDWGLKMTLAKEIPLLIARTIEGFMQKLEKQVGHSLANSIYAVHPGGPKIIELVGKKLNLRPHQIATSEKILYNRGNMSSATLPHIWEDILGDTAIPDGSTIVGLAFGPGLCMCGVVLQKVEK